jgi:hypothetical protein
VRTTFVLTMTLLLLCSVAPAANTIYENGPVSGDYFAWRFNSPNTVSDSFTVSSGTSTISGLSIWAFIFMTDHNPGAEVVISSGVNGGGTVYFDQTVQFATESNCYANLWGNNECMETANWAGGPNLPNGIYWITLKNGTIPSGSAFGWDQNAGVGCNSPGCPSQASLRVGTIPSEAFTILGSSSGESQKNDPPSTMGVLMLTGGFVSLVGLVHRKLS